MLSKLKKLNVFLALLAVITCSFVGLGNSWFYPGGGVTALPNLANVVLDLDGNATAGMNGGSISDGDPISTYVERSTNAESWTESTTHRLTYKANILNGKGVFRIDPSTEQRLKSSARTLVASGSPFTIYAVLNLSGGFDQAYKYFFTTKGASGVSSPSMGFSTNASYKDFFWGCGTTFMVLRFTTIASPATGWKWIVLRYNGSGATTSSNYAAYNAGSVLTTTTTAGNDGDGTYNILGAYKTASNPYGWNGDIARLVMWDTDIGSGGVTTLTTVNSEQYAF